MELIYSVIRKGNGGRESLKDEDILCRLSTKNIVAFSTSVALEDNEKCKEDPKHRVYICDITKPWDYYSVDSFDDKVTALEWHPSGFNLLILTESGRCACYEMKDFQMNRWVCKQKSDTVGERFIAAAWFAQPHRVVLNGDKRESLSYTEKMSRERCVPVLQQYGGRAILGWVAVTASNLVVVGVLRENSEHIAIETACLGPLRTIISVADITFDTNRGHILIATSNGNVTNAVTSYRVIVTSEGDMHCVQAQPMAGFHVQTQMDRSVTDSRIRHVRFMDIETGKALIVAVGNVNSSQLELWAYRKYDIPLHHSFSKHPDTKLSNGHWVYQSAVCHASMPVSIAIPSFPVQYSNLDPTGKLFQCLAVAYKDGTMKIVSKPSFQVVCTTNLDMGFNDVDRSEKRRKLVPCIISMQQTFTGCGLVGIDQLGSMYMMKVLNTRDPVTHVQPHYLVAMLEYLTMSGHDCWDLLIALRPGVIENVIQRFVDNFAKQANVIQELLYQRHMAIRASLYRCATGAQERAADCHCRLMLHLISTHFKSLLQPKGMSAQDMGPAEKLTLNCNKKMEGDIDKVMMTLNPVHKEFVVDERTLLAIQPLVQWVADLTLYLLTSLPAVQGFGSSVPCSSLLHDSGVLSSLRELLVMIRMWALIHQRPLLHFTMSTSNLDPLLEMFKLLTKVWQISKEGKGSDFEDQLLDKCCLLQSQIYTPPADQLLLGNMNYASSLLLQNHPLKYTYGEVPIHVLKQDETTSGQRHCVDAVRLTSLGRVPADRTRSCVRCESITCVQEGHASVPALKAWEGKWTRQCLCGGHWKYDAVNYT